MRAALVAGFVLPLAALAQGGLFEANGDVGSVLHKGSVEYDARAKTYRVTGSGENLWGTADAFQFAWKKMSGDVSITADISFANTEGEAHKKALLMIRQSLDDDSPYADAALHGNGLTSLQSREAKGAATHEIQANVSGPKRLRITKAGKYFYISIAAEGEELHAAGGAMRLELQDPFYVGIGVCAHNKDNIETALFSNVQIATAPGGPRRLYSTLETITISSTDRRAIWTGPELLQGSTWANENSFLVSAGARQYRIGSDGSKVEAGGPALDSGKGPAQGGAAYVQLAKNGSMQIWRRAGDEQEQITSDEFSSAYPHLSPDGQRLVFLSYPKSSGGTEQNQEVMLRLLNLSDRKITVLAKFLGGPGSLSAPPWSANGRQLTFVSYQLIP
jgi:WD40-like Beta Propeller Repeat